MLSFCKPIDFTSQICYTIYVRREKEMKNNLYRRMERNTAAWDLTADCRKYIYNNKNQRKLRRELRRKSRKAINRFFNKDFTWQTPNSMI